MILNFNFLPKCSGSLVKTLWLMLESRMVAMRERHCLKYWEKKYKTIKSAKNYNSESRFFQKRRGEFVEAFLSQMQCKN